MPSKLELTTAYIEQMYSGGEEFRFDTLSRKIQILQEDLTWRNLTDKDVNTIACDCAQATNANITDREVRIALGSNLVQTRNGRLDSVCQCTSQGRFQSRDVDRVLLQMVCGNGGELDV